MNRNIVLTAFTRSFSTLINFAVALVIVRYSGSIVKGDATLMVTTISFLVFFSNFLGGQALVYLLSRNKIELLVVPAYVWSVVVAAVGYLFMRYSGMVSPLHTTSIAVLSLLSSLISIHHTVLMAKLKFAHANFTAIVSLIVQLSLLLACYHVIGIFDIYAFIYSLMAAYLITLAISTYFAAPLIPFNRFRKDFTIPDLYWSLRYGFSYQVVEILQFLNVRYYFYQLGLQQGIQYLGVYSIGISILESVWIIPRSIAAIQYVAVSNTKQLDPEKKRTIDFMKLSTFLCTLCLLIIYLVPSSVYAMVFGEEFRKVKHATRFLYPGILIYNVVIVISSYYLGRGKYMPLIISYTAGTVVLMATGFFLLPAYVISGAGLAATLSFTTTAVILVSLFLTAEKINVKQLAVNANDLLLLKGKWPGYMGKKIES